MSCTRNALYIVVTSIVVYCSMHRSKPNSLLQLKMSRLVLDSSLLIIEHQISLSKVVGVPKCLSVLGISSMHPKYSLHQSLQPKISCRRPLER